jgi:hypothetical protein
LARLLWFAMQPERGFSGMPSGWARGHLENPVTIHAPIEHEAANKAVKELLSGQAEPFCQWIRGRIHESLHPFEKAAVEVDLEYTAEFFRGVIKSG